LVSPESQVCARSDVMKGGDASSAAAKLEVVQFSGPSGQDREFCSEETKR